MSNKSNEKNNKRTFELNFSNKPAKTSLIYANKYTCAYCSKPIKDLASALTDAKTNTPVHFDCVLDMLNQTETLKDGEVIVYIGQGRFAVIQYVSPVTMKEFNIIRIIEWEDKNNRSAWRNDIADQFSKTS
ncbi:MAG: hypothetical protein ACTTJ7_01550 [Treponema sp.]